MYGCQQEAGKVYYFNYMKQKIMINKTSSNLFIITYGEYHEFKIFINTVRAKNVSVQTYTVTVNVIQPVAVKTTAIAGNLDLTIYVAGTSAKAGGDATGEIVSPVTERGICWNTDGSPTVDDSYLTDSSGYGEFTNDMTGLTENTTYYVRAYVVNGFGTAYGNEVIFNSGWAFDGTIKFGGYVFYNDGNGGGMVAASAADTVANRLPWYWSSTELEGLSGVANAYAAYFYPASYSHGVVQKDSSISAYVRPVRNF